VFKGFAPEADDKYAAAAELQKEVKEVKI